MGAAINFCFVLGMREPKKFGNRWIAVEIISCD
jgi:hypothetical protein